MIIQDFGSIDVEQFCFKMCKNGSFSIIQEFPPTDVDALRCKLGDHQGIWNVPLKVNAIPNSSSTVLIHTI